MKKKDLSLTIGWLYPDLMSTYGDRGNIIVLSKRCEARDINVKVKKISVDTDKEEILSLDLIFMGGAQDKQQEIVNYDLLNSKGENLKKLIENNVPGLFICGAYQFLGNYYKLPDEKIIQGLSIFDMYTESPSSSEKRLIGDIIVKSSANSKIRRSFDSAQDDNDFIIIGFENHGGRTYLSNNVKPLAKVIHGYGNNGKDGTEGAVYKNAIGSYLHGPALSKNPELADDLIEKALYVKYGKEIELKELDDSLEKYAKESIVKRYAH